MDPASGGKRARRLLRRLVGLLNGTSRPLPSSTQSSRMHKTVYSI
ncbi:MAG: hypothetical protein ACP5HM_14875 [Anaerolineae bacterium]